MSRAGHHPDLAHPGHRRAARRTVADAAVLLGALAGADPRDARDGRVRRARAQPDYTAFLDPDGLRGARIGVAREKFFGYSDATDRLAEAALERLRREGAVLVDPADIPHAGDVRRRPSSTVLLYELKADLNAYLATLGPGARIRTLADVIAFNEREREREMPYFGQELFVQAEAKGPLTDAGVPEGARRPAAARARRTGSTR